MLRAAVAALACLQVARGSPADNKALNRAYNLYTNKDLGSTLAGIEERLRVLDTISAIQMKHTRRLDAIQDKLDRMENQISFRLERAELAAERLEHRIHMLQTSVQASIKESSDKLDRSQMKITEIALNLTNHVDGHRLLLEKVNGAYTDTWRRGLVLESMMREGLTLVNATRREMADGLNAVARRQRGAKLNSADLETNFARRIYDKTYRMDLKIQELLDAQKQFVDSCQRVQLDDPTHVADVLDKLIDSLINKTASTFHELQNIQTTMRNHDTKISKMLTSARPGQAEATCRRLEGAVKNMTQSTFKGSELHQLTEKFVALTNRADAALQRLEATMSDDGEDPDSDITAAADKLFVKLKGINSNEKYDDEAEWEDDNGYFNDDDKDMMNEDRETLTKVRQGRQAVPTSTNTHRRHLHKHPYDRGPKKRNLHTST